MKRRVVIATVVVVAAAAVLAPYSPTLWHWITIKEIKVQRHPNNWEIVETNRFGAHKGHWNGAYQIVEDGVVRTNGFWVNGLPNGLWTHYLEDGKTIKYQQVWDHNTPIEYIDEPPWREE